MKQYTVNERILEMVHFLAKGNKSAFSKAVGISNQSLAEILGKRQSAPSFAALQKIFVAFPQVRMEWLVLGQGGMFHEKQPAPTDKPESTDSKDEDLLTEEEAKGIIGFAIEKAGGLETFMNTYLEAIKPGLTSELRTAYIERHSKDETERMHRTYHLGAQPSSANIDYDDRLTARLKPFTEDNLRSILNKPVEQGGLRHRFEAGHYYVTEEAIREWERGSQASSQSV